MGSISQRLITINMSGGPIQSLEWNGHSLRIIDQTYLPQRIVYSDLEEVGQVWEAIKKLRVRGAPAIGIAASYGFYLGIRSMSDKGFPEFWLEVERIADYLESSRPTAVNLHWAVDRVKKAIYAHKELGVRHIIDKVLELSITIHDEDRRTCKQIGLHGLALIPQGARILTHCNTGSLATAQYGTALSMIYHAHEAGKQIHVWVDETRPLLQGARLTAWELSRAGIPMKLVTDSMAGWLMKTGQVDLVVVGADRIATNGDTANKIGTYSLAVLCKAHGIPFYVAAPLSTFDPKAVSAADIPIEERDGREITHIGDHAIAPEVATFNPAFDITPGELITAFITEEGIQHRS